ncbi:MAG: FadR/GntR family transcriptional regulator [Devosia sp.]
MSDKLELFVTKAAQDKAVEKPSRGETDAFASVGPLAPRELASEKVARSILELVRTGNLKPGERLPSEHELTRVYKVSRPTIREALRGLSLMGVVSVRHGGGATITELSAQQLVEPLRLMLDPDTFSPQTVCRSRKAVETALVRDACARIDDDARDKLSDLARYGLELVEDPVGFRVLDLEFHTLLNRIADNPLLSAVADALYAFAMDHRRIVTEMPGAIEQSARDHMAIAEAIAAGDPDLAAERMERHIDHIERTTVAAMAKEAKA